MRFKIQIEKLYYIKEKIYKEDSNRIRNGFLCSNINAKLWMVLPYLSVYIIYLRGINHVKFINRSAKLFSN